jgi:CYTH domain-containing protein
MGTEVERKYLVAGDAWRAMARGIHYRQGYLNRDPERTVRIRSTGHKAYITIKGLTVGASRPEYEYEIPLADGDAMIDTLVERPIIEKRRYEIAWGDLVIQVDEFLGENAGLVIAEIELRTEDQVFDKPSWLGEEVTGDPRYYNANLIRHPYSKW